MWFARWGERRVGAFSWSVRLVCGLRGNLNFVKRPGNRTYYVFGNSNCGDG